MTHGRRDVVEWVQDGIFLPRGDLGKETIGMQ